MRKLQLFLLAGACATPTAVAADACFPGITVKGMGSLDGDYMKNPVGYPNTAYFQDVTNGSVRHAMKYGCNTDCSEDDEKKYAGKWVITEFAVCFFIGKPCRVLAVCADGCPEALHDKGHPYWWPSGGSAKKWDVISKEGTTASTDADVSCCKRQPQKCDSCDSNTCGTLLPTSCNPVTKLLHPTTATTRTTKRTTRTPRTPRTRTTRTTRATTTTTTPSTTTTCCFWYGLPVGGECTCQTPPDVCDHASEEISKVNGTVVV